MSQLVPRRPARPQLTNANRSLARLTPIHPLQLHDSHTEAWTRLAERAREYARRILWGTSRQWVEDVAQEAILRIFRDLPSLTQKGFEDVTGALKSAVRFGALSALRRQRLLTSREQLLDSIILETCSTSQCEHSTWHLETLVGAASVRAQFVIDSADGKLLRSWVDGATLTELARENRCGVGTVHRRIRSAADALQAALNGNRTHAHDAKATEDWLQQNR